jgi:DNA polymerase (family 10)
MFKNNERVIGLFRSMADLLAAQRENPYRIRAYRRAADAIIELDEDVEEIAKRQALEEIDGIGRDLSEKIVEVLKTGTCQAYEALKTPLPGEVKDWAALPGFSESLVSYLHARLHIRTLGDLEQLVQSHLLRTIPGFSGSEEELLRAIRLQAQSSAKTEPGPGEAP